MLWQALFWATSEWLPRSWAVSGWAFCSPCSAYRLLPRRRRPSSLLSRRQMLQRHLSSFLSLRRTLRFRATEYPYGELCQSKAGCERYSRSTVPTRSSAGMNPMSSQAPIAANPTIRVQAVACATARCGPRPMAAQLLHVVDKNVPGTGGFSRRTRRGRTRCATHGRDRSHQNSQQCND